MIRIAAFIGTRPEAIKVAPVVKQLRKLSSCECVVISTGQHREMLNQALRDFDLTPDLDLDVMQPNQTLSSLSSRLFDRIDSVLAKENFDWILVQGDTTTAMVASLCGFYRRIRVGHIEAGLRSHVMDEPFPEEMNRRVTALVADLHFAPTDSAYHNLISEKVDSGKIFVTGNTCIDALLETRAKVMIAPPALCAGVGAFLQKYNDFVLITGHRRENFGDGFKNICEAVNQLSRNHPEIGFLYPVHLNPNVRTPVLSLLSGSPNILLTDPVEYKSFVYLMSKSRLILSDSGGVQEEAPSLGKPVLVMRDVTERIESVIAGCSELVGSSAYRIVDRTNALLKDDQLYRRMSSTVNPYGDGSASIKIVQALMAAHNN